jgi:nucleoside-diphosphate-sugar epimerase
LRQGRTKELVIGASGFLGSHVTRAPVERSEDVRVLIRTTSSTKAIDDLDVERYHGDIFDDAVSNTYGSRDFGPTPHRMFVSIPTSGKMRFYVRAPLMK